MLVAGVWQLDFGWVASGIREREGGMRMMRQFVQYKTWSAWWWYRMRQSGILRNKTWGLKKAGLALYSENPRITCSDYRVFEVLSRMSNYNNSTTSSSFDLLHILAKILWRLFCFYLEKLRFPWPPTLTFLQVYVSYLVKLGNSAWFKYLSAK